MMENSGNEILLEHEEPRAEPSSFLLLKGKETECGWSCCLINRRFQEYLLPGTNKQISFSSSICKFVTTDILSSCDCLHFLVHTLLKDSIPYTWQRCLTQNRCSRSICSLGWAPPFTCGISAVPVSNLILPMLGKLAARKLKHKLKKWKGLWWCYKSIYNYENASNCTKWWILLYVSNNNIQKEGRKNPIAN